MAGLDFRYERERAALGVHFEFWITRKGLTYG